MISGRDSWTLHVLVLPSHAPRVIAVWKPTVCQILPAFGVFPARVARSVAGSLDRLARSCQSEPHVQFGSAFECWRGVPTAALSLAPGCCVRSRSALDAAPVAGTAQPVIVPLRGSLAALRSEAPRAASLRWRLRRRHLSAASPRVRPPHRGRTASGFRRAPCGPRPPRARALRRA